MLEWVEGITQVSGVSSFDVVAAIVSRGRFSGQPTGGGHGSPEPLPSEKGLGCVLEGVQHS